MKSVLWWLDLDQESNIKDVENFLRFPTGIHVPSYDQGFGRYVLSKVTNAPGILHWTDWSEMTILNFDQYLK
jgi:hypothetical protein